MHAGVCVYLLACKSLCASVQALKASDLVCQSHALRPACSFVVRGHSRSFSIDWMPGNECSNHIMHHLALTKTKSGVQNREGITAPRQSWPLWPRALQLHPILVLGGVHSTEAAIPLQRQSGQLCVPKHPMAEVVMPFLLCRGSLCREPRDVHLLRPHLHLYLHELEPGWQCPPAPF